MYIILILKDYTEVLIKDLSIFKVADMRNGKVNNDGYKGIHLYYQKSNKYYPIEIQINSKFDRTFNDWLHIHLYKHTDNNDIGILLRKKYDNNEIKNENEFKETLKNVLSNCKKV